MNSFIKLIRPIFYSILFISIAGESFIAVGCNLKRTEAGDLQVAESDNPREALKKSIYADQNVKSYRMRMQTVSNGFDERASNETTILELVRPDRTHIIGKNEEGIIIGKQMYRKKGDGPWKKFPESGHDGMTEDFSVFPSSVEAKIETIEKAEDVKLIGREIVDGISTLVYQYSKNSPDKSWSTTTKKWIAEADSLTRRIESTFEKGSKKLTMIWTIYDYNADIKIEPPDVSVLAPSSPGGVPGGVPGGGIGSGSGGGIGSGTGVGPGHGYNVGGGNPALGGGDRNAVATAVDQRPVPLNAPQPRYTEEARKNKIQGIVVARVLVGADGAVKQVRITRGLPDGLDEQAVQAAYGLRFRPAMKGGQPVAFWQSVQIEFRL